MIDSSSDVSLLTRLNALIIATTALIDRANISENEVNVLANSIKDNSDNIVTTKDTILESYNQIKTLLNETVKASNDTTNKVYSDSMALESTANKSPIANKESHIDHKWFEPVSIPSEDYSLPLKDNLYLTKGKAYPVQMDVSQAQDGSVMVDVPNLYSAKGENTFNENGLEVTKELVLSDNLDGRTISSELGEIEYIPANPKGWTANFDGERTRIDLDEPWICEGDWDLYVTIHFSVNEAHTSAAIIGNKGGSENARLRLDGVVGKPSVRWSIGPAHTGCAIGLNDHGTTKIKVEKRYNNYTIKRLNGIYGESSYVETQNTKYDLSLIGNRSTSFFKGNITDLKLIDLSDPKNCRHYPIVIYSNTEPATRVVEDVLSSNNPTLLSNPDIGNWTNYPRLSNGLLAFTEGAWGSVKIKGKFKTKPDNGNFKYYHGTNSVDVVLNELEFESEWLVGNLTNPKGRYGLYNDSGTNYELEYIEILGAKNATMVNFPESNAFIETVERPPLPANPESVAEWTVNYEGKASITLLEWKPNGDFDLTLDIIRNSIVNGVILYDVKGGVRWLGFDKDSKRIDCYLFKNKRSIPLPEDFIGFTKASFSKRDNILTLKILDKELIDEVREDKEIILNQLGTAGNGLFFKGQISNLKLIDYTDPENCRFYKGIVYSDVDPEAADVQMPNTNMLKDEWCNEDVYIPSLDRQSTNGSVTIT